MLKAYINTESYIHRDGVTIVGILRIYSGELLTLDGEYVLCAQVEAQALHLHLLGKVFRNVVSQLYIAFRCDNSKDRASEMGGLCP